MSQKPKQALFAPGEITCTSAALQAMQAAGVNGFVLLCHHIRGNWGAVSEDQKAVNQQLVQAPNDLADIVSCYQLLDGVEVVVTTSYVATPSLRWTDICLIEETIDDDPCDEEQLDPLAEVALIIADQPEEPVLETEGGSKS
jgi:hypothetical protein